MRTLNLRKIRWVVREMRKKELSTYEIARQQKITPRHARRLYQKYGNIQPYKLNRSVCLQRCGRRSERPSEEEIRAVLDVKREMGFGACNIEKALSERGIRIPHNRIHRILLENGLANNEPKKGKRRKWIRYERRHSNSMWHADWTHYKGGNILFYEDDSSRLITGYVLSKNATTDITISTFDAAIEK